MKRSLEQAEVHAEDFSHNSYYSAITPKSYTL